MSETGGSQDYGEHGDKPDSSEECQKDGTTGRKWHSLSDVQPTWAPGRASDPQSPAGELACPKGMPIVTSFGQGAGTASPMPRRSRALAQPRPSHTILLPTREHQEPPGPAGQNRFQGELGL